ncbi:MAG TPA: DNA recombination protein RmuC [Phenylobacterium sp.]|jgi:DNA recombination protein RmuC|uniref:DNA recombination protein RmuC n=1 Tax=Phenylobacterium sp. TaxID=1871053 RepID=UPI002D2D59C7|nr:DNA recombination protein RmuC [Phenylobacterium sp.]HZZ69999.1 DNA recombination protein RmuC [Phenylobacterium sp.]
MNGYLILAFASAVVAVAAVAWALWERSKGRMQAENARVQAELMSSQVSASAAGVAEAILKKNEEAIHNREQLAQARLEAQLKPVAESLQKFQEHVALVEKARAEETGGLKEQIAALLLASTATQDEARKLSSALRRGAGVQGRWGEQTLRNVLEQAGLSSFCDFTEQASTDSEEGRRRPDVIVKLPGGGVFVIDAKCSLNAFLELQEAASDLAGEEAREAAGLRHVSSVRGHVAGLSAKAYWDQFDGSPDFVAMFVPLDSALAAAVDRAPTLMTEAMDKKVVIVTPTTLFALCKAVVYGWRVEEQAANARTIAELGRELYKRIATMGAHAGSVGKALEAAVARYNQFVGSLETQVLTQARRFEELKVDHEGRKVELLEPLDTAVRPLAKLPTEPPPQVRLVKGEDA